MQGRDTADHVGLGRFGKLGKNVGAKTVIQIRDDQRDNLRMFVDDQFGDRSGIHPVENLDRAVGARGRDPAENGFSLVVTQRARHHIADVISGAEAEAGLLLDDRKELVQNPVHCILVEALHRIHGGAEMLHLARRQVTDDLGRLVLADQHHQDGRFLRSGQLVKDGAVLFVVLCFCHNNLTHIMDRSAIADPGRRLPP